MRALYGAAVSLIVICQFCLPVFCAEPLYGIELQHLFQAGKLDLHSQDEEQTSMSPWSFPPTCTSRLKAIDSELCVYSSRTFAGGRGISLFTTPKVALEIAESHLFENQNKPDDGAINSLSGTWYTKSVAGKGIGMFATNDLPRGHAITANTPVLMVYTELLLPKDERERLLQLAIDQLPGSSKDSFLNLSNVFDNPEIPVQDIIAGNAFGLQVGDHSHLAVFPEVSRVNHDCSPNSQFYLEPESLAHRVHAVRPIRKDEEITIAYLNPLVTFKERQDALFKGFHFLCKCSRCSRGDDGDELLHEIADLQSSLADWGPTSDASVKKAERLVKLYKESGLEGFADPAYCHAALTYSAVGSDRGAQKYYDQAIETQKLRLGPWTSDLGACNGMKDNLRNHWSWRRRKLG